MGLDPTGTGLTYGAVRSWDGYFGASAGKIFRMKLVNTALNTFVWDAVDGMFSNNPGKLYVITLGCPADYLISRAAIGGAAYGGKSNMCPDDLTTWAAAVATVATRMRDTWGVTGAYWELWNEFDTTGMYADSTSLLGPYTAATVAAIKGVDPTAKIIAPSVATVSNAGVPALITSYLTTSDGQGGTCKNWLNGIGYHSYKGDSYPTTVLLDEWNKVKTAQAAAGTNFPVWITEAGYHTNGPQPGQNHKRSMYFHAAIGARGYFGYNYNDVVLPYGILPEATQWNAGAAPLKAGALISEFYLGADTVQLVIDGTTYTS